MEARIGIAPDNTMVRGSKDPNRPLPIQHMWEIESRRGGESLYDKIEEVLSRLIPVEAELAALRPEIEPDGGYVFQIVRYLNYAAAEEAETRPLGFGFELEALELLARLGARIDVDEYDSELGDE